MRYIKKDIKDIKPGDVVFYSHSVYSEHTYYKNFGIVMNTVDAIDMKNKLIKWKSFNSRYEWTSTLDELEIF